MVALRLVEGVPPNRFEGANTLWLGGLMEESLVFRNLMTNEVFLSLGFVHAAVMMWRIDQVSDPWRADGHKVRHVVGDACCGSVVFRCLGWPIHGGASW